MNYKNIVDFAPQDAAVGIPTQYIITYSNVINYIDHKKYMRHRGHSLRTEVNSIAQNMLVCLCYLSILIMRGLFVPCMQCESEKV